MKENQTWELCKKKFITYNTISPLHRHVLQYPLKENKLFNKKLIPFDFVRNHGFLNVSPLERVIFPTHG